MNDLEKIQADMAFYAEVGPILEELEAAREAKKEDPERWAAAKAAVDGADGVRTFYRQIAEYLAAVSADEATADGDTNISVGSVDGQTEAISPKGK